MSRIKPAYDKDIEKQLPLSNSEDEIKGNKSAFAALDADAMEVKLTKRDWAKANTFSNVRYKYDSFKTSERQGNEAQSKTSLIREFRNDVRVKWKQFLVAGRSNLGIFVLALLEILVDVMFAGLYLVEAEYSRINFYDPRLDGLSLRWRFVARSDFIFYLANLFSYISVCIVFFKFIFAETRMFSITSRESIFALSIAIPFFILDAFNERLIYVPYGLLLLKG
jgi:hypothetical protein